MKEQRLYLLGHPVSHSRSAVMYNAAYAAAGFPWRYELLDCPTERDARAVLVGRDFLQVNITTPYKPLAFAAADERDVTVDLVGGANVLVNRGGRLVAHNTDGAGFLLMLRNSGVDTAGKSFLVLGCGGVGRSVIKKLLDAGAQVFAFDLNKESLQKVHAEFPGFIPLERVEAKPYDVVVNCTGVGMHRTEGVSPVGADVLSLCSAAVDLIYVPAKSEFLRIAESCGKKIVNGEAMLFYQAYFSDCIYLGAEPSDEEAGGLFAKYKEKYKE